MGRKVSPSVAVFESQSLEIDKKMSGKADKVEDERQHYRADWHTERKAMREDMSRESLVTPTRSGAGAPDRVRVS